MLDFGFFFFINIRTQSPIITPQIQRQVSGGASTVPSPSIQGSQQPQKFVILKPGMNLPHQHQVKTNIVVVNPPNMTQVSVSIVHFIELTLQ